MDSLQGPCTARPPEGWARLSRMGVCRGCLILPGPSNLPHRKVVTCLEMNLGGKGWGKGLLLEPLVLPPARAHTGHFPPTLCQHLFTKHVSDAAGMLGHNGLLVLGIRGACRGGAHRAGVKMASLGKGHLG